MSDCDWEEQIETLSVDTRGSNSNSFMRNDRKDNHMNRFVGRSVGRGRFSSTDESDGNSNWNSTSRGDFKGGRGRGMLAEKSSGSGSFGNGEFSSRKRNDSRGCFKCHEDGHLARDCPNSQENKSNSFNNKEFSSRRENNSKECFKCHQEGHFARDCPNSQNDEGNGSSDGFSKKKTGCFNCNEEGHIASNCDKPREERKRGENGEGKPPPMTYVPEELGDDQLFSHGISVGVNFSAYDNVPVKVSGSGQIAPKIDSFAEANLRSLLLENVIKAGYKNPTPVQKHSIPVIMSQRDLMACAQTGSGKTAAFLLPILHYIIESKANDCSFEQPLRPTALVLAPTRELAIQIYNEARKFSSSSILKIGISYGGTSVSSQNNRLQGGVHVLVATCGRLLDFVERGMIAFDSLKYLVLDEADRMLDLGFKAAIDKIVNHSSMPAKENRQTLMFSATFALNVQQLAKMFLNDYVFIVTGLVGSANVDVRQTILEMKRSEKRDSLLDFIKDELAQNDRQKIIVFVETKRMADFIAIYLSNNEMNTTSIHGDRFQSQREQALNEFKSGQRNVLVATAVAARGLDIQGVGIVINYDMPKDIDEYVHRIGRTGRVGNPGRAVSYFETENDSHLAKDLMKLLQDAEQEVPEWLMSCGEFGSGGGSYRGRSSFGATDMRRSGITIEEYPAASAVGGPGQAFGDAPNDEECWD